MKSIFSDRPLNAVQQRKAADYHIWAERYAIRVWRESAPKNLGSYVYLGDDEDARDFGIQGLIAAAQRWPLPCPRCKGRRTEESIHSGIKPCPVCVDCAKCADAVARGEPLARHDGHPHNVHTAWHTYLRLTVVTTVRNEINRRVKAAGHVIEVGRTGGLRKTGRQKLDDDPIAEDSRTEEAECSASVIPVYTACSLLLTPSKLPVEDIGLTSTHFLAPCDFIRRRFPVRSLGSASAEMWKQYTQQYQRQLKRSLTLFAKEWEDLITLAENGIVLTCTCMRSDRCHRSILGTVIASALATVGVSAEYVGEIVSTPQQRDVRFHGRDVVKRRFPIRPNVFGV